MIFINLNWELDSLLLESFDNPMKQWHGLGCTWTELWDIYLYIVILCIGYLIHTPKLICNETISTTSPKYWWAQPNFTPCTPWEINFLTVLPHFPSLIIEPHKNFLYDMVAPRWGSPEPNVPHEKQKQCLAVQLTGQWALPLLALDINIHIATRQEESKQIWLKEAFRAVSVPQGNSFDMCATSPMLIVVCFYQF